MFTTFVGKPASDVSAPHAEDSPSSSPPPPRPRPKKRSQVARACDWCRVHRVKCDNELPCSNCQDRGVRCTRSGSTKSVTLPTTYREIERLRQKVQELELELKTQRQQKSDIDNPDQKLNTVLGASINSSTGEKSDPIIRDRELLRAGGQGKGPCEGIHIRTARSPQKTWYGSSSIFYFIGRINAFLTTTFQQDFSAQVLMPKAPSSLLDAPTTVTGEVDKQNNQRAATAVDDPIYAAEYLTPTQEEYFLDLFWQSYFPTCPIFDEVEFKEYYQSLWSASGKERKPSALVDIVLAICMQYGVAQLPDVRRRSNAGPKARTSNNDATIAGRWHYRRCQTLLSSELESPTLSTLQCHILSCLYLCCGSFMNMADHACSQAVRTAYMLGLHLEPPQTMPRRERELRKRVWWTMFAQETKMSMKLGRPFLLYDSSTTCTPSADDREIAVLSGPSYSRPEENVTWLTWSLQNTRLMLAARAAYTAFYHSIPNPSSVNSGECVIDRLNEWLRSVPESLKMQRQNNGKPLSTDLSPLDIEQFAPMWLQRQRLLLELLYHNLCTNLYRPNITFPATADPSHLPDGPASKCASHALALTHIMHQVLLSTPILAGWVESFQWQWNASLTLVGFVLAYPQDILAPTARAALDLSIEVFEKFGDSFAVAASAADIMRDISYKADFLLASRTGEDRLELLNNAPTELGSGFITADNFAATQARDGFDGFEGVATADITGVLGQSIDILAAEPYTDFDWPGINGNFSDQWTFSQPYTQEVRL